MKRKTFLKVTSAVAATALLKNMSLAQTKRLKNWAENLEYSTSDVRYPKSAQEAIDMTKRADKLRVLGTRHCFNRIADSRDMLLSSAQFSKILSLDKMASTVTVEAGIRYGEMAPYLDENGFALHNLASLPHISVAGSCATATHGSGVGNGNLATAVHSMELITADGSLVNVSADRDKEKINAMAVSLGAFGMITRMTLRLVPSFGMKQYVYEHLPMKMVMDNFVKIMSAGYSVSLFTDWQTDSINEVWIKCKLDERDYSKQSDFYGAKAASRNMHPIASNPAENCTEQMGLAGPWYKRLPHFKMGFTPSNGRELQSEYFVPQRHAEEAIQAIMKLGKRIGPSLFISEIRTIAADDLWMSPHRGQSSVAIHFTWKPDWPSVSKLLPVIETELEPFSPRPHWGKLFSMAPSRLAQRYDKLADFKKLVAEFDPKGKFRNEFLQSVLSYV